MEMKQVRAPWYAFQKTLPAPCVVSGHGLKKTVDEVVMQTRQVPLEVSPLAFYCIDK